MARTGALLHRHPASVPAAAMLLPRLQHPHHSSPVPRLVTLPLVGRLCQWLLAGCGFSVSHTLCWLAMPCAAAAGTNLACVAGSWLPRMLLRIMMLCCCVRDCVAQARLQTCLLQMRSCRVATVLGRRVALRCMCTGSPWRAAAVAGDLVGLLGCSQAFSNVRACMQVRTW